MGESLSLPQDKVDALIGNLARHLAHVPEVQAAMALAESNPETASQIFTRYIELIGTMSKLSQEDKQKIQSAKKRLTEHHGHTGSADETTAAELVDELGDTTILPSVVVEALNPSQTGDEAIGILAERMEGGHRIKASGKTPSDGDSESDKVIWGHTQITNPPALLHFTVCHYLERYYSIDLVNRGVKAAHNKDFFLNALIDVVILDHFKYKQFEDIYSLWARPKPEGMGWVIKERLDSYSDDNPAQQS